LLWRHQPNIYRKKIAQAMDLITQGETYEVCLTNQLTATATIQPLSIYQSLRQINPAPFAAFLRFDALAVLCSSPELFLKISREGVVESKPIKGTAPRHTDANEDQLIADKLANSVKNRAENLMIVDLIRNDFNRVCEVGSVQVPKIFDVESYVSVHQLVSTVRGKLRQTATPMDCIRAAFPGGSMTGAPKVRTMAILDELEEGARGIYSGSLGYLSITGSVQLNIVIRTIVINGAEISMGTGGAIVALSDPEKELEETVLKVRSLLGALNSCGVKCDIEKLEGISLIPRS
jgi:para-aminobenzoate synthetase